MDKKDQTNAYAYLCKYSDLPIWKGYPVGQMLHEGVWSWRGLPHPGTINNSPIMSFRKFLITQFFEGRQDVIIWALLGFLGNLEDVEIRDWRTIATQAGRDLGPMQRHERRSVGMADADAVSRFFRGVFNSQLNHTSLATDDRWGFKGGVGTRIRSWKIIDPADSNRLQPIDSVLGFLVLPSSRQACLSLFELKTAEDWEPFAGLANLDFNLEILKVPCGHMNSTSLANFLGLFTKLKTFFYA